MHRGLVVAVGDSAYAHELLLRHVGRPLALLGEDAVCDSVAGPLAEGDGWDCRALGDDLVGSEVLLLLGQLLRDGLVAGYVECEEIFGVLLCHNTTAIDLLAYLRQCERE